MTPTTLAAGAAQALQGVTEGPWAVCGNGTKVKPIPFDLFFYPIAETNAELHWEDGNWVRKDGGEANARFIAFARAWVPEAAAALTALSAERDTLAAKLAEYEAYDGMEGAIVHAIRALLHESNVPGAAFIDDHVANAIVQRDAIAAQVAELTREREAICAAYERVVGKALEQRDAMQSRAEAAEAKVARLEGALRDIADPKRMASHGDPAVLRHAARAALTEGTPTEYERKVAQMKEDFPNGI